MNISNPRNPIYADEKNTLINLTITTDTFGDIPFTASPNDVEEHGRQLYADAVAGKYGSIAPYVAPPTPPKAEPGVAPKVI